MKCVGKIIVELIEDRNVKKWRVNLIKNNHIRGFIKPFG